MKSNLIDKSATLCSMDCIVPGLYGVLKICETATFSIRCSLIEVDSLLYILGKVKSIVNNGKSNINTWSSSTSDSQGGIGDMEWMALEYKED
jgi:hypothetical protein